MHVSIKKKIFIAHEKYPLIDWKLENKYKIPYAGPPVYGKLKRMKK